LFQPQNQEEEILLVLPPGSALDVEQPDSSKSVIEWTPPNLNWDPWVNQSINKEGAEEYQVRRPGILLYVAPQSIRNSKKTKAENIRLETKQHPVIQTNLTKNTIDSGIQS
jgi:hypothetical protein